jgi:lipopolysaccharide transport system ATP-binding protein
MATVAISARGISKQYSRGPDGGWSVHGGLGALARVLRGRGARKPRARRDKFWALDDISFEVTRGERVGIVGRNGAGKSTLLKVLSRVVYPTKGTATIRGRLTSLLEVGTGFNENLSGRENVYLNASIHGLSRTEIDSRIDDIVEFAGIRPFLDTPVKRYSSGMQMRLAFAVAAHLDPDILLLDEVLAVGDLSFQQKCLERVEGLVSEGRTLLFVSHSLDAISRFCDRCIWLDGGKIRQDGPAERVVEAYLEELAGVRSSRLWAPGALSNGFDAPDSCTAVDELDAVLPEPSERQLKQHHAPSASIDTSHQALTIPGDDDARLLGVRLLGNDGRPRSSVAVDEPLGVEITYEVLREGKNVQPALHFKSATDQYLFVVSYTDPEWVRVPPTVGRHAATAWVPAHLLNVGITHITVALNTPDPFETHCAVDRAVSFNVYERFGDGHTARGLYGRDFPGAVRPRLHWDTHRSVSDALAVSATADGRSGTGASS